MDDCLFCKIVAGALPSQNVYEDANVLAFLDIHPVNPGHTLIVPKAHSAGCADIPEEDLTNVMKAAKRIAPGILKTVGADSFNLTTNCGRAAGQIIFHTHFHLIPRFPTDGYKHWRRDTDEHQDLASVAEKIRRELA
jgi:histidine triad (HIT) family protein